MCAIPKLGNFPAREKSEKLQQWLETKIYTPIATLKVEAWLSEEPLSHEARKSGVYKNFKIGDVWGKLFDCAWFNFTGDIPNYIKNEHVVLDIDFSGEGCVFDENGTPIRGLTTVTTREDWSLGMWGKTILQINDNDLKSKKISIWADAGCNDLEGQFRGEGRINKANISICNDTLRDLYYDLSIVNGLFDGLCEDNNPYADDVLSALESLNNIFDIEHKEEIMLSSENIKNCKKTLANILRNKNDDSLNSYSLTAIGHAHIDLLFLWPQRETVRKAARTFSTVLDLMERYDEFPYHFCCSQPQLYVWVKEAYPELYGKILGKIKDGVWEPIGAMWCETDTNMPSGESLVRQILYGKEFFKKELGINMKVGFLPDVFGYSGALPQIFRKSEIDYFTTQKLCWNTINTFPQHTFVWKGIDGSEILTHLLPEDSYQSQAVPQLAMKGRRRFKNKDVSLEALELYGVGDGGGGPGPEHIERLIRQQDLKGVPLVKQGRIIDFFERIEKKSETYPKWHGELYLERHQGTYTSIGKIKKYNRLIEQSLKETEFLSSLAWWNSSFNYPNEKIEEIWKEVLLYQFHDCLPGSSISRVYHEAFERYEILLKEVNKIKVSAISALAESSICDETNDKIFLYNCETFERREWIKVSLTTNPSEDDHWKEIVVPPLSAKICDVNSLEPYGYKNDFYVNDFIAENNLIKVVLNENGTIKSIFDKENNRETLRDSGNILLSFEDKCDCWDIQKDYKKHAPEQAQLSGHRTFVDGPNFGWVLHLIIGNSIIKQKISMQSESKRVDFATTVDWKNENKMLRVHFPTTIVASEAKCEIQFGHISRPTHSNTSWDFAKEEICIQRFADLSDSGYGVAILSDSKHGACVKNNIFDLNLIRAQTSPSQGLDICEHNFSYSILPHNNSLEKSNVKTEAIKMSSPLLFFHLDNSALSEKTISVFKDPALFNIAKKGIFLEALKLSQDNDGLILRLYDSSNSVNRLSSDVFVNLNFNECNLIENPIDGYKQGDFIDELLFLPFEIKTFLLKY